LRGSMSVSPNRGSQTNNNKTFTWSGPSGVLGRTGQRRVAPAAGWCMPSTHHGRRLSRCAIEPAESPGEENLRGGKRLRLRFWKGCLVQHTYPFALNRPLVASSQLCSPSFAFPLGVRPLPLQLVLFCSFPELFPWVSVHVPAVKEELTFPE
jgi:hypothetical protein